MIRLTFFLVLISMTSASVAQSEIHPHHSALIDAYEREESPATRAILAANIDRWRRLNGNFDGRYLIVNAAAFDVTLWDGYRVIQRWPVIVGTTRTPTPEFSATVSGVILNPWWEIPSSIAAEGIASMVRNNPRRAAQRGYVYQNGRYRQRPGPGNALGRMKLIMPNPHSVFLHDTSNRSLFEREARALSHGCVRVGDALDFVTALASVDPAWNRERVDSIVQSGRTRTVSLDQPIQVYVSYFTAVPRSDETIEFYPDIYRRDVARIQSPERLAAARFDRDDPFCQYSDQDTIEG
ncbi:MAG: L,D-transpeptidase family protein [Sphingomonadaceae bacterium]|nr:L,D-transpeptidase family protein [Sphingomonadaceae bacterium]